MVTTRKGATRGEEPISADLRNEDLERAQERVRLLPDQDTTDPFSTPETRAVPVSARRVSGVDARRPIMDNQQSEPSHSELSTMAPMMAMMVELQKEIGELRRRRDRHSLLDSDDSEDGSGHSLPFDLLRELTPDEQTSRSYRDLLPTPCHDPRFRRTLDYRYYRLSRRSERYDASVSCNVAKWTRQLEASLKLRFDGSDPLAIIQFITSFVEAANTNGIREGAATYVLRAFLDSPAREEFTAFNAPAFPVAVDWLLTTYAPVSAVAAEYKAISSMVQGRNESPREFGLRLRQRASRLGPLMDDAAVTILLEGLDPSLSGFVQSALKHQKPTFTNVLQEADLVYSSVVASERRSESRELPYASKQVRVQPPANLSRGLPVYPRGTRQEGAQVFALEDSEEYARYREWRVREDSGYSTGAVPEWEPDAVGENVEQVLFAQVVQPQRSRYCYTCWRVGHFSAECPLIPDEEREGIASRRAAALKLRPPRFNRPTPPYATPYTSRPSAQVELPREPPMEIRGVRSEDTLPVVAENGVPVGNKTRPYGTTQSQ